MARRQIESSYYEFYPAENKIVIPRVVRQDRLMLITNTTAGRVIYNFSEPTLTAQTYSIIDGDGTNPRTEIVLKYACQQMNENDSLAIIVDEQYEEITYSETLTDGVNKLRVAPPQSLMDTDFEYGVQGSKWEALVLASEYPSFFSRNTGGNSYDILSITGDGVSPKSTVTVEILSPAPDLKPGSIVSVQDSLNVLAEGTFPVESVDLDGYRFTYLANGVVSGNIKDGSLTAVAGGGIFDNAHIPGGNDAEGLANWTAVSDELPESTITVITNSSHGLLPGQPILVGSQNETNPIKGSWRIFNVPSPNTFKFKVPFQVSNPFSTAGAGLYAKPNGYIQHRPHDGGVMLSTTDNVVGTRVIRQTRRNFRYQSGKAIQFSTGVKFTPTFDVDGITIANTLPGNQQVTIRTIQDHGLQPGAKIRVSGVETAGSYNPWNGDFVVETVSGTNEFSFTVTLSQTLDARDQDPGGIDVSVTVYEWLGAATRCGMYNDQNGFFFEYDGNTLYAVRRFTKKQLFGTVSVTKFSNIVTGTNTRFRKQLVVGDQIAIKGANYRILEINSDTELRIAPAYKGETLGTAGYLVTQEIRVPQEEWNIDRMDGEGPTGYTIDPTKMQMAYIDYTWYGAGFVRFGFRTTDGNVTYCHKMANNNTNTEAYMRSGNLPARYEAVNSPFFSTKLMAGSEGVVGSALNPTEIVMYVASTRFWPDEGHLVIKDDNNVEIAAYTITDKNYNEIAQGYPVNIARRQSITSHLADGQYTLTGTSTQATFRPDNSITNGSGVAQVSVQTISNNCAPVISHWGSSVIMDGTFDDDKNFMFTAGMQRFMNIAGSGEVTARISSKSADGGVATLVTAGTHSIQPGYPITVADVTTRSLIVGLERNNSVITFNTSGAHNLLPGQKITINGLDRVEVQEFVDNRGGLRTPGDTRPSTFWDYYRTRFFNFNGEYTIQQTPHTTSFTLGIPGLDFEQVNIPITQGASATERDTFNGSFTVTNVTSNTIEYAIPFGGTAGASIVTPQGAVNQSFGTTATARPLLSIRIAPSADNGIGRNYGVRETLNYMQLTLEELGILAQGAFLIEGIYNAAGFSDNVDLPSDWEQIRVPGGSLAQVIYHDGTGTIGTTVTNPQTNLFGGDRAFAFYTDGTGGANYSSTTFDLSEVTDLGTSILSGDGNKDAPGFPNGPDILTIVATNLGLTSGDISARLSWTEAQA